MIEEVQLFDHFYQWMDALLSKGCGVISYVLMPNHVHLLLFVPEGESINSVLSNMKRFSAYEVIKRLKASALDGLLSQLAEAVNRAASGSQHYRVWRISSDIKLCYSDWFIQQKLDYIHGNPVRGSWELAEDASSYEHSSAAYYLHGIENKHVKLVHVDEVGFL